MKHICVIGCGSIGERHIRTFLATGRARVTACDNRAAILEQLASKYGVAVERDWEKLVNTPGIDAAVIATPAPLHVDMAIRFLRGGRHVLIEKPLSTSLDRTDELVRARDESHRFAVVAYVYHSFPALVGARNFLRDGSFGPLKQVVITSGQHFPTYRPAYREIYYRDHRQGGGAIQDALTHLVNLVEWVAGPTTRLYCEAAHQVLEGVDVEDTVSVSARNGDIITSYAINQFQAASDSRFDFHAEHGTVRVEAGSQRWGVLKRGAADWTWHDAKLPDRDSWYVLQAEAFLDGCEGRPTSLCSLEEGIQTLRVNLAALESMRTQKVITLS